ncbi:MAG: DUF4845 domain-containing protein [Betaproteobacteria bacterium]|nr:DUF4845 domain-containing protein [Betaproteobacteria bacterium]
MRNKQTGMTVLGMLFIGVVLVFVAFIAMKLAPAYIEYGSVRQIMSAMAQDPSVQTMTPEEIRDSFDRRADIDNVNSIAGRDLEISTDNGRTVIDADYTVKVHLLGNISALMDFKASTGG